MTHSAHTHVFMGSVFPCNDTVETTRHVDTGVKGRAPPVNTYICIYNKNNAIPETIET